MRRFDDWSDELLYRVKRIGHDGCGDDELYAGGVYDMAMAIALAIDRKIEYKFNDIDEVVEIIYNAIKYGEGVDV